MDYNTSTSNTRLVFVSVRHGGSNNNNNQKSSSRRKVAVPIHDGMRWESFVDTVRMKLKLSGVGDMYLVSSGVAVKSLDQLQDIDEVHVEECAAVGIRGDAEQQEMGVVGVSSSSSGGMNDGGGEDDKYVKKQSDIQRTMKRMMPGLFVPKPQDSLPLTKKDTMALSPIEQVKRRMKKRNSKRSIVDPRTMLAVFALLSCSATLLFVYLRATRDLSDAKFSLLHKNSDGSS